MRYSVTNPLESQLDELSVGRINGDVELRIFQINGRETVAS